MAHAQPSHSVIGIRARLRHRVAAYHEPGARENGQARSEATGARGFTPQRAVRQGAMGTVIAEMHSGTVTAWSEGVGKGSTFTLNAAAARAPRS